MLSYRMINENILEVIETSHTFTKTSRSYWYYNIKTWYKSSHGKMNDPTDRKMNESDIEWVKKYYIPKTISLDTI